MTLDTQTISYLFTLRDVPGNKIVEYRVPLRHPNMLAGLLRVEETTTGVVPMVGGGTVYRHTLSTAGDDLIGGLWRPDDLPGQTHAATLLSQNLDATTGTLSLRYRDTLARGGVTYVSEKTYSIRLVGAALEVQLAGDETVRSDALLNHVGFMFGDGSGLATPNMVLRVPYMDATPVFVGTTEGGLVFCTRILDWYRSSSSDSPRGGTLRTTPGVVGVDFQGESPAVVAQNDQGKLNAPLRETAYLTVSRTIEATFPVIDRPRSEYHNLCASRAVSQVAPNIAYVPTSNWVRRFANLGMDEMQQTNWSWMKWPIALSQPDYAPGGTSSGTPTEFSVYAAQTAAANWGLTPYFEGAPYDRGYPTNPMLRFPGQTTQPIQLMANPTYSIAACVRDAFGALRVTDNTENIFALYHANLAGQGLGNPVHVLAPHERARVIGAQAALIASPVGFPVGGSFIDAKADLPGWIEIDQARQPGFDKTIAETLRSRERYFRTVKDRLAGPLLGENGHFRFKAFETYAAGLIDGTQRKIPMDWDDAPGEPGTVCWDAEVIPDFELTEVAPKASGFYGMGWEFQFLPFAAPFPLKYQDAWFTTMLSFGHGPYTSTNGDVLSNYWDYRGTMRSYYLCYGVSQAIRSGTAQAVRYEDASGNELPLGAAIGQAMQGTMDLKHPRLIVRYDNGLEFKANHSRATWVTRVGGTIYTIPTDGFAAAGSNGLLALSILHPTTGRRIDYAFNPGHSECGDPRGTNHSFNGFPGAWLPAPLGTFNPAPPNPSDTFVVRDLRSHQVFYAYDFQSSSAPWVPSDPTGLRIVPDATDVLSVGRPRLGLCAKLLLANNTERDVTRLATWSSSATNVATVSGMGAVTAVGSAAQPVTIGASTITASFRGFVATRTLSAQMAPIVGRPILIGSTSTQAVFTVTTDCDCPTIGITLQDVGTTQLITASGRSDPAQKTHTFVVPGLQAMTTYSAKVTAFNAYGVRADSGSVGFMTP